MLAYIFCSSNRNIENKWTDLDTWEFLLGTHCKQKGIIYNKKQAC